LCAKRRAEDEGSSVVDVLVASCVVAAAIFAIAAAAAAAMAVGAVLAYRPFPHILKTGKQSNPNPNPNPLSLSLPLFCCFSLFLFVGGFMSRSKFLPRWFFLT